MKALLKTISFYLALIGLSLGGLLVYLSLPYTPAPVAPLPKTKHSFSKAIAAAGLIEASHRHIQIGIPKHGIIKAIYREIGDHVEKGTPLFRLDDRELYGQFLIQKADTRKTHANLKKAQDHLRRLETISDARAISQEELDRQRCACLVAQSECDAAEAQLTNTIIALESLHIFAPEAGVVLKNNLRPGESISPEWDAPVVIGNLSSYQVRVDIDEHHAPIFRPSQQAVAYPRQTQQEGVPLIFSHIEPVIIPKQSLTGDGNERVDTRVLQVIYTFDPPLSYPVYVGQQVDVFIQLE